jgi:putative polyhydroxyalkanoate system protein
MQQKKTVDVSIPHRLTRAEAKSRIRGGAERLSSQLGGQVAQVHQTWQGDHADFKFSAMGQSIAGTLDIEDQAIKLSVELPWMLALLADKIRGRIEQEGKKLLENKK